MISKKSGKQAQSRDVVSDRLSVATQQYLAGDLGAALTAVQQAIDEGDPGRGVEWVDLQVLRVAMLREAGDTRGPGGTGGGRPPPARTA